MELSDERQSKIDAETLNKAAAAISGAKTLIIAAGAGMGVDSGLPDFRGEKGFWRAYPLYEKLGLRFTELATPGHFIEDPQFAWGFYGHRVNMYREAVPHEGFAILRKWIEQYKLSWFVMTSNVDGQFQKAGFAEENIVEVHGSVHHMQCVQPCKPNIWHHDEVFPINMETMKSTHVPLCARCGDTARPNVLMFNDWSWIPTRSNQQQRNFEGFLSGCPSPMTVVELGAGRAIPTIRWNGESLTKRHSAKMIRINLHEAQIESPHLPIASGAESALQQIDAILA